MTTQSSELLEKIRQQFDFGPYPRIPVEKKPDDQLQSLFVHNLLTPYYLRHRRLPKIEAPLILDLGCGTGYGAMQLAVANPGARIVGVDISERSIELAKERFAHHHLDNSEFHVMDVSALGQLHQEFDYINCDELLYLFPEPGQILDVMGSVLKPLGMIRSNFHSLLQRSAYFRAQEMFQMMGLMDENPEELEIGLAVDVFKALKSETDLRKKTYPNDSAFDKNVEEKVLMNLLFQGDKGYTIPQMFRYIEEAGLAFISMVNPRQWELSDLFKDPDNLPVFLAMGLDAISIEERLHLFELIQAQHRLLDFWCGHPVDSVPELPLADWPEADWMEATVHLHPQLKHDSVKDHLTLAAKEGSRCCVSQFLPQTCGLPIELNGQIAATLLLLWQGPQKVGALVDWWLRIHPVDVFTGEPVERQLAFEEVQALILLLEEPMHVLVERG